MKLVDWLLIVPAAGLGLWLILHDPDLRWNEEVELQSGEVIVIKRTAKLSENWIAGGGGGAFNKGMTIEFESPDKPDTPAIWSGLYVPMILDRDPDTHEWIIVATFYHCDSWYDIGRPKLPYTAYRYREGKWLQLPMEPKWIGRKANLIAADPFDRKAINASGAIFTLSDKGKRLDDRPGISPEYKKIAAEWSSGC